MDNTYQQYAPEATNAHCVLAMLVRVQTFSTALHCVLSAVPKMMCWAPLCAGECQTAEGHYNSQGARAHSKQKGSEQAGFVQPIFNYLEGVNKDEITLFSEAHSERMRRHFLLQLC